MDDSLKHQGDRYLLLQISKGDKKAFDVIYHKYWQSIYDSAFQRLQDAAQSKDITQDVFLQIWLKRETLFIDNLPAYLHTATRNKVLNLMHREELYTPVAELFMHLQLSPDQADATLLKNEFLEIYEALIDTLPPSQQQIFRMRYQQDLSTQQIAEQLNISRKTVQNQLGKAVSQLKNSLALLLITLLLHK